MPRDSPPGLPAPAHHLKNKELAVNLISTSWSCQRCGAAYISTPPEHGLCGQCIEDLEALAQASLSESVSCPSCGGPVCPDCGDAMATVLVPVPIPAPASITEQVDRLIAGYRAHRQEITAQRPDHAQPRQPDRASGSAQVVLTASQSDCLRDMLADAITYQCAPAEGCPCCQGSPAELCQEHSPAWSVIQAYRQLAADLGEVTGDDH
jgi:hypothetical protein